MVSGLLWSDNIQFDQLLAFAVITCDLSDLMAAMKIAARIPDPRQAEHLTEYQYAYCGCCHPFETAVGHALT